MLVCCIGAATVAFFFRHQIESGFSVLNGDRSDQVIEISILEHWYNVFRGLAPWRQTGYFYPVTDTLGYNDGYFIFGCIYSVFRVAGIDPYLGAELVNVCLRGVAFLSFYVAARRILAVGVFWALLAAVLFTLSNNLFVQASHGQLFTVCLIPLMAVLLHEMVRTLHERTPYGLLAWGVAAQVLYAAWLMSAFYTAWYFLFYGSVFLLVYLLIEGKVGVLRWTAAIRDQLVPLGLVILVAVLVNIPFLTVYLPKANESGMHSYRDALFYTPSPLDLISVGSGNLLYGSLVASIDQVLRPGFPSFGEWTSGFPPVLLFLFGCGLIRFWLQRHAPDRDTALLAIAVATVLTWACSVKLHSASLWLFVYELFPGAKAIRVVSRYQLFLAAPVIAVACVYLARQSRRVPRAILGLLATLLVLGEINTASTQNLDRRHELARLLSVPSPPTDCRAFFISAARPGPLSPADKIYSHNVDAMIIAEVKHLPTLNGFATFTPPGWALVDPTSLQYLRAVRAFARDHHVGGLCSLDLQAMRWSTDPFTGVSG